VTPKTEPSEQLALIQRANPLILVVSAGQFEQYKLSIDGEPEERGFLESKKTILAKKSIVLTFEFPTDLHVFHFILNGKPYYPSWIKDSTMIGTYESIRSAKVIVEAPQ
jgi:hypothetical protein